MARLSRGCGAAVARLWRGCRLHIIGGIVLMVMPYFAGGVVPMILLCGGVSAGLFVATRLGF